MKPHQIIKRPLLTEKATQRKESGGAAVKPTDESLLRPKVVFEVHRDANKVQVRESIEALFSVKVETVQTQIVRGKEKRVGRFAGRRPSWKKAIVTLAAGQKIEFFEGV